VTDGVLRPDTAPAQPAPPLTSEERERMLQELRRKQIQNAPSSDPGRPAASGR